MAEQADQSKKPATTATNDEAAYRLHSSDHPGVSLVNHPLVGSNYLAWSTAIRTSLEAKDKIGFVYGSILPPDDLVKYKKWKTVDSMIKSWIVNSTSKELVENFIYCQTSKALWDILEECFGFLMGLNPTYDVIRSQILNLDPLPSANKAYSMVMRVEKHRQINMGILNGGDAAAMMVKAKNEEWFKELRERKGAASKKQVANACGDLSGDAPNGADAESANKMDLTNMDQKSKKILAKGAAYGKLYYLTASSFSGNNRTRSEHCNKTDKSHCNAANVTDKEPLTSAKLWHSRLGHASIRAIKHIDTISLSDSLNDDCEICHVSKQHRLPFSNSDNRSGKILELLHIDLWGPYRYPTLNSAHYFLTIVDDNSRATWVFLLQQKTQEESVPLPNIPVSISSGDDGDLYPLHPVTTTNVPAGMSNLDPLELPEAATTTAAEPVNIR
ncbi:uncharacterized protein G2W53_034145 [Senna tora]|uniref:GAG-pre-integrase domain-containing protein n=1 Tax=Senna tora TaxID=362788 RepID=A0A834WDH9_9FABA|nr:uncharacterized protein G2W53_034145 [Senna tora]